MGLFDSFKKTIINVQNKVDAESFGDFDSQYEEYCRLFEDYKKETLLVGSIEKGSAFLKQADSMDESKLCKRVIRESKKEFSWYCHPLFGNIDNKENAAKDIYRKVNYQTKKNTEILKQVEDDQNTINIIPTYDINIENGKNYLRKNMIDMPEIKVSPIGKSFDKGSKLINFVVIDCETTGLKASNCRIIQLSAIRYSDFVPVDKFNTYINPKRDIPEEVTKINGITNETVNNAPIIGEVLDSFCEYVGKLPIVGYNISFDLKFLYGEGLDLITKRKIYDVYSLSKKAFKDYELDSYSLENVASICDKHFPAHDSLNDCFYTEYVFEQCLDRIIE